MSVDSTLKATGLNKSFDSRRVVDNVSFDMHTGEVVGLFGPNGAGKTTTFYSVIGFVRPDSGRITIDDEDITYLPQEPSVFRKLSVANNLKAVLEFHETDHEKIEHRVQELLETFKLEQLAGNNADLLSGGERRRLEVARALMMSPRFILLDEPFSGIDPISVADLKKIVDGLKKRGIGILLSDHNVRESLPICDRAYIMSEGKIILEGDPSEIVNNKVVREVYLGEEFYLDVGT